MKPTSNPNESSVATTTGDAVPRARRTPWRRPVSQQNKVRQSSSPCAWRRSEIQKHLSWFRPAPGHRLSSARRVAQTAYQPPRRNSVTPCHGYDAPNSQVSTKITDLLANCSGLPRNLLCDERLPFAHSI